MADFENPGNNSYTEPGENKRNNAPIIILALLLLASVGFNVYQFYSNRKSESLLKQEVVDTNEFKKDLEADLDSMLTRLSEYKGINASLDSLVAQREQELISMKEENEKLLRQNKISYNQYLRMKDDRDKMKYYADKYLKELNELKLENERLLAENQTLQTDVSEKKVKIEKLTDENVNLSNKVSLAARLKAENISVIGVRMRDGGKERETDRAKNIEKLKICFTLPHNEVANQGERQVYIQILDPKGQTVAIESLGSGTITVEGEQAQYSTMQEIDFQGDQQNYCVYWGKESKFEPGKYTVNLYTEGYKLGEKVFNIK